MVQETNANPSVISVVFQVLYFIIDIQADAKKEEKGKKDDKGKKGSHYDQFCLIVYSRIDFIY